MTRGPTAEEYFEAELQRLHSEFKRQDYLAFFKGLLLCVDNRQPLADWIADVVVRQAEAASVQSFGLGRHGNWPAAYKAKYIDDSRASLAKFHLRARRKKGRHYVSELGKLYSYGKPAPQYGGVHIVTRDDVFKFLHEHLRGKPEQGSPAAIEASYKKRRSGRSRHRTKRVELNRGGE